MAQNSSNIPYDPLDTQPRVETPQLLTPDPVEFGPPRPGFFEAGSRSSVGSTLGVNARGSAYGSIAPLRSSQYGDNNSHELSPVGPTSERYRDDPTLPVGAAPPTANLTEKDQLYAAPRTKTKRKALFGCLIAGGCLLLVLAIVLPVYFLVIKPKSSSTTSTNTGSDGHSGGHASATASGEHPENTPGFVTSGGDGSIVTKDDGTTFVYNNSFGGFWVFDPANPLNESAQAQSWTKPLSQEWAWGTDKVYGVNLGGWLNLEPFISPALYEPFYPNAVDEWTLCEQIMQRDGNLNAIEEHYKTFIVEEDFAMIAAAGLNWLRIPIAFWAIEKYPNEPFLERVSWNYFLKAIEWARKYGLRINLDLHALPGSQNGWNHSGKLGKINFLAGVMGVANAQRALDHVRIFAEFISQPEYKNVVPFFGIINEPRSNSDSGYPVEAMQAWYAEAYRIIRNAGGTGAGNGPFISIHDAFYGMSQWTGFLSGADRLAMDHHPYLVFAVPLPGGPPSDFEAMPCGRWAGDFSNANSAFGVTTAGEWSHAINDCGLYVNAVGRGTRYEGTFETTTVLGSCDTWNDHTTWDQSTKDSLRQMSLSTMDALQNWFFWTWRIGESSRGRVEAPFWSYKLAVLEGWAPTDPRESVGQCQRLGQPTHSFTGPYQSWQIGGAGAGTVPSLDSYPWPPTAIGGFPDAAPLPQYTATGAINTLPVHTYTYSSAGAAATADVGDGWNNAADTTPMAVPVADCTYPDQWDATAAAIPTCGVAGATTEAAPVAEPTPI
ncbi:hypothetical protein FRC18_006834 [Serendipita sp. 400]|nr:hypothetical protein FRC18_006834 [Serendipita sp. 400]